MRLCTADVLVDLGYDVIEAASGEQALRLLDEGPAPDVLVTDYLMPGMSGADLAQAVRARKPGLPILIVSGYANPDGIAPDLSRLRKPSAARSSRKALPTSCVRKLGEGLEVSSRLAYAPAAVAGSALPPPPPTGYCEPLALAADMDDNDSQ